MQRSRTAILHLGTYKTGSSSIQNLLYLNRTQLAEKGVLYPEAGIVKEEEVGFRHRRLIVPVMKGNTSSYVVEPLQKELKESPETDVILSNESWSNPLHLPMLGGFVAELRDLGFDKITGILFLRRLIDYKISHYREFTFRRGNHLPFDAYLLRPPGMFDYLFLVRSLRSIFGPQLRALNYALVQDSVASFFDAADMAHHLSGLDPTGKANTKSIKALGIEVLRHANKARLSEQDRFDFLSDFETRHPELFQQNWTERSGSDTPVYGLSYHNELASALQWPDEQIELLLKDRQIEGRYVGEAEDLILQALQEWAKRKATSPQEIPGH
ncbi:hypothetical protein H4P12_03185 [Paracoccus sp. 11-3]|uniref:Sulfotransferase domain-containing protein n=1 Tax=Paracoccus amoyensis TaxID=2760093 RepID=A0A926J515_9RHOB|nr:hypothetical protein [Paracoccus amoyensis]MBC9245737.1 hypothetical protein [Paracoccus amoyensis]